MGVPANLNITIFQGADFVLPIQMMGDDGVTPINITGCTFKAQLRSVASSPDVIDDFDVTILDGSLGEFEMTLTAEQTLAIPVQPSSMPNRTITNYCYDLFITYLNGQITRLLEGVAFISPDVTRDEAP